MGQQELFLTILVTIIIGVSMVVAVNTMKNSRTESNKSSARQDILYVLNDAQIYYEKSERLGGGNKSFDGISQSYIWSIEPTNENGSYEVSGSDNSVTVEGTGIDSEVTLSATATMTPDGMKISWSK